MDKWKQQLIDVLMRSRNLGDRKKRESKAASSFFATEINKAQLIHDFINGKH